MSLSLRGWRQVDDGLDKVPRVQIWRKGTEPFCIEMEIWDGGNVRGRLCAPGMKVCGTMIFELSSVDEGAVFLEKLMDGATKALPHTNGTDPSEP